MIEQTSRFGTAVARWAGVGPYFAMFPRAFCDSVINRYSNSGDIVLDPFAGRGSAVFSAAASGRTGIGVELNPVGWIYSRTKLHPARRDDVENRIRAIRDCSARYRADATALPIFFRHCYSKEVREFLICARQTLSWRSNPVDRTVMALLLVHLHGKATDSLSNQMRQTKAMSPKYAVEWWKARDFKPPKIDVVEFFRKKCDWRYSKGRPQFAGSRVFLGDSTRVLPRLVRMRGEEMERASLLLTSPPYFGITNYHYDQWLRLWLLGGPPTDRRSSTQFNGKHRGKFVNQRVYREMMDSVFLSAASLLKKDAVVYVRTDRREPTFHITRAALLAAFPNHKMKVAFKPNGGKTQTGLFGHFAPRSGEIDLLLAPK